VISLQRVDPFIPVSRNPVRQPRRSVSSRRPVRKAIDGFMPGPQVIRQTPQPLSKPVAAQPKPQVAPAPTPPRVYTRPKPPERSEAFIRAEQQMTTPQARTGGIRRGLTLLLQFFALLTLFAVGFLLRSVLVGQAIILIYAIFAFVFRIESRTTFVFVLISFGVVLTASLRSDTALASVFAVYAFLLLIVGTVSLGREVRNEV
jgi:hypothetical protein